MRWRRILKPDPPIEPAPEPDPAASRLSAAEVAEPAGGSPRDVGPPSDSPSPGRPAAPPTPRKTMVFAHLSSESSPEVALIRQHVERRHGKGTRLIEADFIDYSRERYT